MIVKMPLTAEGCNTLKFGIQHFGANPCKAVLEGAENSLENCSGKPCEVDIQVQGQQIVIKDNGDGIDPDQFRHIHIDKKRPQGSRNGFGCGIKFAAGAVGDLHVETVRNGTSYRFDVPDPLYSKVKMLLVDKTDAKGKKSGSKLTLKLRPKVHAEVGKIRSFLAMYLNDKLTDNTVTINGKQLTPYVDARADQTVLDVEIPIGYLTEQFGAGRLKVVYSPQKLPQECEQGIAYQFGKHVHDIGYPSQMFRGNPIKAYLSGRLVTEKAPSVDGCGRDFVTEARNGINLEHEGVGHLLTWVESELVKLAKQIEEKHKKKERNSAIEKIMPDIRRMEDVLTSMFKSSKLPGTKSKHVKTYKISRGGVPVEIGSEGFPLSSNGKRKPGDPDGCENGKQDEATKAKKAKLSRLKAKLMSRLKKYGVRIHLEHMGDVGRARFVNKDGVIKVNLDDPALQTPSSNSIKDSVREIVCSEVAIVLAELDQDDSNDNDLACKIRDWSRKLIKDLVKSELLVTKG